MAALLFAAPRNEPPHIREQAGRLQEPTHVTEAGTHQLRQLRRALTIRIACALPVIENGGSYLAEVFPVTHGK